MKYQALSFEEINLGSAYSIIPIRHVDMELIRQWRNAQMDVLRQKVVLSAEMQDRYFQNVVVPLFAESHPKQILVSFLKAGELIGYGGLVNISWEDKRAEMSFLVNPEIAADLNRYEESMTEFIALIQELVFNRLRFNRVFTETFEFRTFHISILEKSGFIREGVMREHVFEHNQFYNSIIHGITKKEYDSIQK